MLAIPPLYFSSMSQRADPSPIPTPFHNEQSRYQQRNDTPVCLAIDSEIRIECQNRAVFGALHETNQAGVRE